MKRWKIKLVSVFIVGILIVVNGINNSKARKEKPFLSKEEITDFLVSIGVDEKTVSTMNLSDVYLSDIPDDFWSWMNVSKDEAAKIIKDAIYEVINNKTTDALKKLIELFPYEEQKPILTFGPETLEELKKKPNVIAVYGKIPKFDGQEERWEWLNKLAAVINKSNDEMDELIKEISKKLGKSHINLYGVSNGYIEICVNLEIVNTNMSLLKSTYKILEEVAMATGIKDLPVVILGEKGELKIKNCGGRIDKYRPIEGGIQVYNGVIHNGHRYWYRSTIGYPAKRYGVKGYVVAGHLGYNLVNPTPIGDIFLSACASRRE